MRAFSRLAVAAVAIAFFGACKPASVTVELGPGAHDYGARLTSNCSLAVREDCHTVPAAGATLTLEPNEETEAGPCNLTLAIFPVCNENIPTVLLIGNLTVEIHSSTEPVVTQFDSNAFDRGYDNDGDGYSNYLEWSEGTVLTDAASVPEGEPDL